MRVESPFSWSASSVPLVHRMRRRPPSDAPAGAATSTTRPPDNSTTDRPPRARRKPFPPLPQGSRRRYFERNRPFEWPRNALHRHQPSARGIEQQQAAGVEHREITDGDWLQRGRHVEPRQHASGDQLQLVHRRDAVRLAARHPEIASPRVDLYRAQSPEPRGRGADQVVDVVEDLVGDDQLVVVAVPDHEAA